MRISNDTTTAPGAQHATEVEPDAFAVGTKVVATYQVGRFFSGSAAAIGFGTSNDAGRTWRSGLLQLPPTVASDPVVAYDDLHRRWLIATLGNSSADTFISVSGSTDGLSWDPPATAVSYPRSPVTGTTLDKEWLTCDNGQNSPLRGHCYLAYTDLAHDPDPQHQGSHIGVQTSTDGGNTWSQPVLINVTANIVSPAVQPVVRPNGELVVVFSQDGVLDAVRSNDGGTTFSNPEQISSLSYHQRPFTPTRLRAFSLSSAAVDSSGNLYVAWLDCRFRTGCASDDIVWTRSTGSGWTPVQRVPLGPTRARTDFVLPDLAVSVTRLALTYYAINSADCTESTCLLDVFLVTSKNSGRTWTKPRRLNPAHMRLTWLAQTASGRMVGDYMGTVFAGNRVVSVHTQARTPKGGRLNESIYALSLALP